MAEFKITVGFDADALEVLNRLAIALKGVNSIQTPTAPVVEVKPEEPKAEPEEPKAEPAPVKVEEPKAEPAPVKAYTLEQIRSTVMALSRRSLETKAAVKAILNKYAESVPKLAEADYAAFMADLEDIVK